MGYRIVRMSRELFEELFVEGYTLPDRDGHRLRVTKGLPKGARLEAVSMELWFDLDQVALKFSHPDWSNEPGDAIPEIQIEFLMEREDMPIIVGGG